jgi:hypothetical protein
MGYLVPLNPLHCRLKKKIKKKKIVDFGEAIKKKTGSIFQICFPFCSESYFVGHLSLSAEAACFVWERG